MSTKEENEHNRKPRVLLAIIVGNVLGLFLGLPISLALAFATSLLYFPVVFMPLVPLFIGMISGLIAKKSMVLVGTMSILLTSSIFAYLPGPTDTHIEVIASSVILSIAGAFISIGPSSFMNYIKKSSIIDYAGLGLLLGFPILAILFLAFAPVSQYIPKFITPIVPLTIGITVGMIAKKQPIVIGAKSIIIPSLFFPSVFFPPVFFEFPFESIEIQILLI